MVTEQTGEAYSIIKCKLKQVATVNNRLEEQLQKCVRAWGTRVHSWFDLRRYGLFPLAFLLLFFFF